MSGEKFLLELSGRPLEGYRVEEVVASLSQLLRIPPEKTRNLLRGKLIAIKPALEKARAVELMGKIINCGAQCDIRPAGSTPADEDAKDVESVRLSDKLELEIEHPGMQIEEIAVQPTRSDQAAMRSAQQHSPIADTDTLTATSDLGESTVGSVATRRTGRKSAQKKSRVSGQRTRLLLVAAALLLLGVAVWGGLEYLGGATPAAQPSTTAAVRPDTPEEVTRTRQRMELLGRSVRIWMIQYGAGFDPSQVTMERIQQDLGIPPQEMLDGWGTPFRYTTSGERFTLISAGPDRKFAGGDDIQTEKSAR
ncbi:MAG: hypothetical protein KDH88_02185 [Chromatiales bacterium]|nr:hypothetical protein [Gammaproteobacteria bacterium]MCB1874764.1 hypothetical protein [Chromatiales bacterium]MCP5418542.1 hypothetical protein [Chromatiaceae bacterium]